MQKLSEEKIDKLISIVKTKPVLYERRGFLRKHEQRDKAWRGVATQLKADVKHCKTAWRSLRDAFKKNLKEIKAATEQEDIGLCKKKYKYYSKLMFLKDSNRRSVNYELMEDNSLEEANSLDDTNFNEDISFKEDLTEKSQSSFLEDTDPLTNPELCNFIPKQSQSFSEGSFSPYSPPESLIKTQSVSSHQSKTPEKRNQDMLECFPDSRCREFSKSLPCHCTNLKQPSFDSVDGFFLSISSTVKNYNLSVSDLTLFQCKIMTFAYEELEKLKK